MKSRTNLLYFENFGKDKSQAIIGVEMASAYIGTCLMPPLFGIIAQNISATLFPIYLLIILVLMIIMYKTGIKVVVIISEQDVINMKNAFLYYDLNTGKQVRGIISY